MSTMASRSAAFRERDAKLKVVQKLARHLMDEHGLEDWKLYFTRGRNQAGICYRPPNGRYGKIGLSAPLMAIWPEEYCRIEILHEIAHALTTDHHGPHWRAVCLAIGGNGQKSWDENDGRPKLLSKYTGTCPNGHTTSRERRGANAQSISCAFCNPAGYDLRYLFTWTQNF